MTTKNLAILGGVAVVLGGVAYVTSSTGNMKSPSVAGRQILPSFDLADVARVEIGGASKVVLAASDSGWKIESLYGYPADVAKIRENLMKLQELKVGQVAYGRKMEKPTSIGLLDSAGKTLATLEMGETHVSRPKGQAAQFGGGGYPNGRYVKFGDKTVLVKETLDAFDGDPKKWADTRIASVNASDVASVSYAAGGETVKLARKDSTWTLEGLGPKEELDTSKTYSLDSALSYLDFTGVADPKLSEKDLGFATGCVYTATLKNGQTYVAKVGGVAKGADRWVKLSASFKATGTNATENANFEQTVKDFNAKVGKWTFSVSSYSAGNFAKTRKELVKAKEETKKEEVKKDEAKPAVAPKPAEVKTAAAPKPAEVKKSEAAVKASPKKTEAKK